MNVTGCMNCCFFVWHYELCDLLLMIKHIWLRVMWFVVLNAIFPHFYHFHPYPSPRTGKYYHLKKHRKIALCGRIAIFYLHMTPYGVIFLHYRTKIQKLQIRIDGQKMNCSAFVLHVLYFLVNTIYLLVNTIYPHIVNIIYHIIHIISTTISNALHKISYSL